MLQLMFTVGALISLVVPWCMVVVICVVESGVVVVVCVVESEIVLFVVVMFLVKNRIQVNFIP